MDKRFALLTQIAQLKSTHDEASALLGHIMLNAVRAANNEEIPPSLKAMRQYRKALKELKSQCLQAEIILAEMEIPQHMH